MSGFCKKILDAKNEEIQSLKKSGAFSLYKRQALLIPLPPSFHDAIRVPQNRVALIGELKRKSPSHGTFNEDIDMSRRVADFEKSGVSAVSMVIDSAFYGGNVEDLLAVAQTTPLPLLCKDYIVDPIQLYRARAFGSSAVLLPCSLLDKGRLRALVRVAHELSLEPVIEVRSTSEVGKALGTSARMISVNGRNLDTLVLDPLLPGRILQRLPESVVRIVQGEVHTREQVKNWVMMGFDACVVGGPLSSCDNVEETVSGLIPDDLPENY